MSDANSELAQEMEEAWKTSEAEPQADLTNLIFTVYEAELKDYEYKGEPRQSYIIHVRVHGEDAERLFWIGGKSLPQIKMLLDKAVLPVVLKQIRDTERTGQPYKLILQDVAAQPRPETVTGPGASEGTTAGPDSSEMPAAIDVSGLFNEAVLLESGDGALTAAGALSGAGLDGIMDVGDSGIFVKQSMTISERVKAVNVLNIYIEEAKKTRAAS